MRKIVFVADARSPIAANWISYFVGIGDDVTVVTFGAVERSALPGARVHAIRLLSTVLRSAPDRMAHKPAAGSGPSDNRPSTFKRWVGLADRRFGLERRMLGYLLPVDALLVRSRIRTLVRRLNPDLVHALRIPIEGESVVSVDNCPVLLSVWGNDLTLFAREFLGHRLLTRQALHRADALHADCHRDIRLAREMGFADARPTLVVPGGGGIKTRALTDRVEEWRRRLGTAKYDHVVINPRGRRLYIKTEQFLESIPAVLQQHPKTLFLCVALADDGPTRDVVARLGLQESVKLLPKVGQDDLFALFQLSDVLVSPAIHDGTPNSLLEGIANGAFPVVGNIESVREWIVDGENGKMCDPLDPASIAEAVCGALSDTELRARARELNRRIIEERADYCTSMRKVEAFYDAAIAAWRERSNERRDN